MQSTNNQGGILSTAVGPMKQTIGLPFQMKDMDTLLREAVFVVEANSFEKQCLWQDTNNSVNWGAVTGWLVTIGHIDGMPVVVSVSFQELNGAPVLFYYATSQVVDYRMVNKWLKERVACLSEDSSKETDAQNFHICVNAVRRLAVPA